MKNSACPLLSLLFLVSTTTPILAQSPGNLGAPATVAPEKTPNWDETFDGVVHDANNIAGFVAEYRWLSNFFLVRLEWAGRVYGSAEAAYHWGKYPVADRDIFARLSPVAARNLSRTKPFNTTAGSHAKCKRCATLYGRTFRRIPSLRENSWRQEGATWRRQIGGAIRSGAFIEARGKISLEQY